MVLCLAFYILDEKKSQKQEKEMKTARTCRLSRQFSMPASGVSPTSPWG